MKRFLNILIIFTLIFSFMSPASAQGNKLEASKTSQKIILDGKEFELSTYTIDGKTYIKLRDFAKFLSTTSKKFSLSYDKDQKLPVIKTMDDYEDENLEDNKEEKPDAFLCEIEIIVNGQKIKISAANISGFIYLEIKDIAKLVGIEFSYNEENKTIEIKNASIIKDVNLTCTTKGCACKHKNKKSFNACPCCSGNNNSSNKGTSGESSGLPSCCAGKKNNKSESSSSSHESSSIDHSKHTVKEVRYKCCEGCGCAHKTLDEYNACPCCMGKDPIAYEIDVEIASDEILARAKAKLNRANENLLRAQTEAKDAALNLQNAKNERTKAEEEKNKADQKLEEAKNKLASAIKAKEEADQRFASAVGEENKAKVLELMTKVEEAKKTKDEAENKLKEKTKELEQAKKIKTKLIKN